MRIREHGSLKLQTIGAGGIHPFHEILYINSGQSTLQWMGRHYELTSPVLIIIPANTPHWLTAQPPGVSGWYMEADMQKEKFLDHEMILQWNQLQAWNVDNSWPVTLSEEIQCVTSTVIAFEEGKLKQAAAHQLLELDIRKLLLLIPAALSATLSHETNLSSDKHPLSMDQHIYTVLRYIERYYTEPITLDELSQMCNFTPSYIIRLFKETIGVTPIQYLQELRLNAAICYLETTEMAIQDIAETIGFSNLHYFSRVFKQKVGESPSAWRKNWRNRQSDKRKRAVAILR